MVAQALAPVALGIGVEALSGSQPPGHRIRLPSPRHVDPEVADRALAAVPASQRLGVFTNEEIRRVNAADNLALSVVGRVESGSDAPLFGVEKRIDRVLSGVNGEITRERADDGSTIAGSERTLKDASPGHDVQLTIDKAMQYSAETVLAQQVMAVGAWGEPSSSVVRVRVRSSPCRTSPWWTARRARHV